MYRTLKLLAVCTAVCTFPWWASASTSNGTIDTTFKYARICHDTACTTYGNVNFSPSINGSTPGAVAVAITDTGITGNAWGDEIGWINFAPTGAGVTINPTTGVLSGYAWANGGSWINFSPSQVGGGPAVGVTIDSSGQFIGWAWVSGLYGGWMRFDCASASTCVKTDWRPIPARTTTPPTGGGGGGGGPTTLTTTPPVTPTPLVTPPTNHEIPSTLHATPHRVNQFPSVGTTTPLAPPPIITPGFIPPALAPLPGADGEYRQVFPSTESVFVSKPSCLFCIIVRRDSTSPQGQRRDILKWAFVPKSFEIPIPMPWNLFHHTTGASDLDVTSTVISALGVWVIWKAAILLIGVFM
jgi:hypothetical protein